MMQIVFLFFLPGLSLKSYSKEQPFYMYNNEDSLLIEWRKDSLGCCGLRSSKTAVQLFKTYSLGLKSYKEIIKILGNPNKMVEYKEKGIILRYYYHSCCKNGKLDSNCDQSWMDFIFEDKEVPICELGGGVN